MARLLCLVLLASVIDVSLQRSTPADDSYVAAVLEYQFTSNSTVTIEDYQRFIQDAVEQNADIIVFPELTLNNPPMEVPIAGRLVQYPIPALQPDLYDEVLVTISAAAREHQIYVVINVEEFLNCTVAAEEYCPAATTYLFNTNVVFDRNGAVIDRYRKINLFGERTRTPALQPDLGVFDTDFGVTFGHFICFDLQFQVPATQVVEKLNVTDVIFSTMWFSELPYLTAVQIQEAYAYSLNVNFLASGANNVAVGSAGSGIFSGRAGALASTMPGLPTTRLLVARVPKVPGQVTLTTAPVPGPTYDPPSDHDSLTLIRDPSVPSHLTRPLVSGLQEFNLTDKEVSCSFRINMQPATGNQVYRYRAAAFSGVRSYSGLGTGGTRICSVIACTGDDLESCGRRFSEYQPSATAVFSELSIVATVPTPFIEPEVQARNSLYFPLSVDTSIMPLESNQYSYTEEERGDLSVYTMILNTSEVELYTFAVWGRYFATDGQDADPPRDEDVSEETGVTEGAVTEATGVTGDGEPDAANVHQLSFLLMVVALSLFGLNL